MAQLPPLRRLSQILALSLWNTAKARTPAAAARGSEAFRAARAIAREIQVGDGLVVQRLSGQLPAGAGPLTIQFVGRSRFARDARVFFDAAAPIEETCLARLSPFAFWRLRRSLRACPAGVDLLLVDSLLESTSDSDVHLVPYLNAVLPVQVDIEAQLQLVRSKGGRRKLQACFKRGFNWRKSQSVADFDLFHDVMYAPFIAARFGEDAAALPRETMKQIFLQRGFLLLLEEDGVPVSGALMYTSSRSPSTLCYWKYGIRDGATLPPAIFGERNAHTEAMVLQFAVQARYTELDFGLTRALPSDGIFTHKKRLGCDFRRAREAPSCRLLVRSEAQKRLVKQFSLLVFSGACMEAWVGNVSGLEERIEACLVPSLRQLRLFGGDDAPALDALHRQRQALELCHKIPVLLGPQAPSQPAHLGEGA